MKTSNKFRYELVNACAKLIQINGNINLTGFLSIFKDVSKLINYILQNFIKNTLGPMELSRDLTQNCRSLFEGVKITELNKKDQIPVRLHIVFALSECRQRPKTESTTTMRCKGEVNSKFKTHQRKYFQTFTNIENRSKNVLLIFKLIGSIEKMSGPIGAHQAIKLYLLKLHFWEWKSSETRVCT